MKSWLWPANLTAIAAVLPLTVALPMVSYRSARHDCEARVAGNGPAGGPGAAHPSSCDPHGYIWIFTTVLTMALLAVALLALGLILAHHKAGLVVSLIPTAVVVALLIEPASLQPWWLTFLAALAAGLCLTACIAGLFAAPGRQTQVAPPPWPAPPGPQR